MKYLRSEPLHFSFFLQPMAKWFEFPRWGNQITLVKKSSLMINAVETSVAFLFWHCIHANGSRTLCVLLNDTAHPSFFMLATCAKQRPNERLVVYLEPSVAVSLYLSSTRYKCVHASKWPTIRLTSASSARMYHSILTACPCIFHDRPISQYEWGKQ